MTRKEIENLLDGVYALSEGGRRAAMDLKEYLEHRPHALDRSKLEDATSWILDICEGTLVVRHANDG